MDGALVAAQLTTPPAGEGGLHFGHDGKGNLGGGFGTEIQSHRSKKSR